jgi:hypothetical protein
MSQAQDAMLGNLPNGIVTTLASHYVTNVMNADPETKLGYGQNAPLGSRPSRLVTCLSILPWPWTIQEFHSSMRLSTTSRKAQLRQLQLTHLSPKKFRVELALSSTT